MDGTPRSVEFRTVHWRWRPAFAALIVFFSWAVTTAAMAQTADAKRAAPDGAAPGDARASASGPTRSIASTDALIAALRSAHGGDVFLLQPGTYRDVRIEGVTANPPLLIASADPRKPAVLTTLLIKDSAGIRLESLEFDASDPANRNSFQITKSKYLTFSNLDVHGDLSKAPSLIDNYGIVFSSIQKIEIIDSLFRNLKIAIICSDSLDINFTANHFRNIREHGIHGSACSNVSISKNTFVDFFPATGDHPDGIWFGATPGTPSASHDIAVVDNFYNRGMGAPTQGIFFKDSTKKMPFSNLTISNNLLAGPGYTGIGVIGANNVVISDNDVMSYGDFAAFIRVMDTDGLSIRRNKAASYSFTNSRNIKDQSNGLGKVVYNRGKGLLQVWAKKHPTALRSLPETLGTPADIAARP